NIENNFSQFDIIESSQPAFNEDTINFLKLNHGLIINSQTMNAATNQAFDIKINSNNNNNIGSCNVKIILSKSRQETFLLENNIESSSFRLLPPKLVDIMTKSTNFLSNNSPANDIRLEIKCQKIILNFEKENIQPTEKIRAAVNNALKDQRPYQELIKVFNIYGYILSQKVILGEKLYEMSYNSSHEIFNNDNDKQIDVKESFKIDLSKLDFTLWKNNYGFDATYLMSLYGEAVKKHDVKKWIEMYYKQKDFKTLQIIDQDELFPLYKIFETKTCCEIESILGIKKENKILMTGIIQIIESTKYYPVSFPVRLKSSNYQVFANIVRTNDQKNNAIDIAFVKIHSATRTSFLAIIENFDQI
ncbi:12596_t:CDS:1, partial [Dentiscutata heterogama]